VTTLSLKNDSFSSCNLRGKQEIFVPVDDLDFPDVLEVEAHLTVLLPAKFASIPITVLDTLEAAAALVTGKPWAFSGGGCYGKNDCRPKNLGVVGYYEPDVEAAGHSGRR
jgi:hypothetical protein